MMHKVFEYLVLLLAHRLTYYGIFLIEQKYALYKIEDFL